MILVWTKKIPVSASAEAQAKLVKQNGVTKYVLAGVKKYLVWDAPLGKGEVSSMPHSTRVRFEKLRDKVLKVWTASWLKPY
jgi:hypothetical protein